MQHFGKGALRVAKNYTKGYSDAQAKVRDATSNDPWGPSGTQMNELAQMTFNQNDFVEIMEMIDKRLNDKGKNWRHVFKSLTVLDYCLHAGSENVVIYFRDNIYVIKTLKEFQYVDEYGKDQGANVRQKAKDITNLLQDEARLRQERRSRAHMRDRMIRAEDYSGGANGDNENRSRRQRQMTGEDELRRAIEESKRTAEAEQAKNGGLTAEERDLMQAIKLSEEEEAKRNKAVEDSNANSLFDDQNQQPSNTGVGLIDPSHYTHGLQPQFTQIQPQFTAFNPFQQQAQQEAMQADYLRQQQEWQLLQQQQQQQQLQQQQQQLQQQQQQQQAEEWMRQQQLQQLQLQHQQPSQVQPQPTGFGSNNPFAPSTSFNPPQPSFPSHPPTNQRDPVEFNLQGTFVNNESKPSTSNHSFSPAPSSNTSSPAPNPQFRPPKKADNEHANLANLLANRDDGQDTFGNIGALRYGQTDAGRVIVQKTGVSSHNPFAHQQQQQPPDNERPFFDI